VHGDGGDGQCEASSDAIRDWMRRLSDRLRLVRVCSGDWLRVVKGPATTIKHGLTAVFLDPPYSDEAERDMGIYVHESGTVAHDVRRWCLEWGAHPLMRIALCGYEGEGHEELESYGWDVWEWKAAGGYARLGNNNGWDNCKRERVWFSPGCVPRLQMQLF
jgi:DNA adenine methylase